MVAIPQISSQSIVFRPYCYVLVFVLGGKAENPDKNLMEQGLVPT